MKIGVSDIEANGFFDTVDLFHCAWIIDPITNERRGYRPHELKEYIHDLCKCDVVVFHNGIDYDIPALMKLHGKFACPKIFDTLVLSRMLEPDRPQGHSLKAWGVALGLLKGDYGEQENAWDIFTEDMFTYCERDVDVTVKLYKHLCELAGFDYENPPASSISW